MLALETHRCADTTISVVGNKHITDIRNFGLAGALQLAPRDGDPIVRPFEVGLRCWEKGLYVRWGGDTLQFAPPFIAAPEQIQNMATTVAEAIEETA